MAQVSYEERGYLALKEFLPYKEKNIVTMSAANIWLEKYELLFLEHIDELCRELNFHTSNDFFDYQTIHIPLDFIGLRFPDIYYALKFFSRVYEMKNTIRHLYRSYNDPNQPISKDFIRTYFLRTPLWDDVIKDFRSAYVRKNKQILVFDRSRDYYESDFKVDQVILRSQEFEEIPDLLNFFYKETDFTKMDVFDQQMILQ